MFKRKLSALQYHLAETFKYDDEVQFRNLIVWLEDQKIRAYPVENRVQLRNLQDDHVWNEAFVQYLRDLKCQFTYNVNDKQSKLAIIDWLLSLAVRLDFSDNADEIKAKLMDKKDSNLNNGDLKSENPLDNLNFEDADFKAGVDRLANILNIARHPNHLITLQAISKLVSERLSVDNLKTATEQRENKSSTPVVVQLDAFESGFDAGDYVLNRAAKILRLLHVRELRDLQTKINETIVDLQQITADPKTDQKLGKIGI